LIRGFARLLHAYRTDDTYQPHHCLTESFRSQSMKISAYICAIAAASLSLGSLSAFAQGRVRDPNASNNPEIYRQTHPEDPAGALNLQGRSARRFDNRNDRRDFDRRHEQRADRRDDRNWNQPSQGQQYYYDYGDRGHRYYYGARGPEFRRGSHIPREYWSRQYYVNDWRGHRLYAPPYGYQWVQVGSDYVLIALATGLIANLILSQ
jgi:Ni/Co efflux regulator RcnB